jgi:outer membrane protein OmpA-like peptidoglycan-associated protein
MLERCLEQVVPVALACILSAKKQLAAKPPQPQSTAASRDTSPAPLTTQATPSAPAAVQALQSDSVELRDILKDYPDYKLILEGYADELGDQRAKAAKAYRVQVGIPSGQLSVVRCEGSSGL